MEVSYRYYRLYITKFVRGSTLSTFASIGELYLYNGDERITETLPFVATANTYSTASESPEKAFDGNANTFWQSNYSSQANTVNWLKCSFENSATCTGIGIVTRGDSYWTDKPISFEFQGSNDDAIWETLIKCDNETGGWEPKGTIKKWDIENVVTHNYNSSLDLINAGTTNMLTLIDNVSYDDNTFTITDVPSWLKFNRIIPTSIFASGNTWFGINSATEHIKFNRRDTKMWYLYREDGTLYGNFRFLKLRWKGYSAYSQTSSSYLQEWEVIFFDTGDFMIHAVNIPTSCYDGTFNIVASQTYTYTKPTVNSPYVSFYTKDADNTTFEIDYKIIQLKCWYDKWLIEDEGVFYNIIDGELNPLEITEITEQNMIDYGNDEIPEGSLLVSLANPKIHHWNDSDKYLEEPIQPSIIANLTAYPYPQTMDLIVNMSHETILGIKGVTAQYGGNLTVSYSLDDGETYTEEESVQDFLNEDLNAIYDGLPESKQLFMRFVFYEDATLTNLKFTFKN